MAMIRGLFVVLLLAVALSACGGGGDDDAATDETSASICSKALEAQGVNMASDEALEALTNCILRLDSADSASSTLPNDDDATPLDHESTCEEFFRIVSVVAMNDAESAAAFGALAARTQDVSLAMAIKKIADAYRDGEEEISSSEVSELCG